MKPSVIVWDLETVPDLGGFAAAHDLVGRSGVEVREAIGDKFPKHNRAIDEKLHGSNRPRARSSVTPAISGIGYS
jgi:hypothetical protein